MTRAFAILLIVGAAACGDDDDTIVMPDAPPCFLGEPGVTQPELQLFWNPQTVGGSPIPLENGGTIGIVEAPQGGKFFLFGARVRGIGCVGQLSGSVIDQCDGRRTFESRPYQFMPGADGWSQPLVLDALSMWSNVPACPAAWASRDLRGNDYTFELTFTDRAGKVADTSITAKPFCADQDAGLRAMCDCQCNPDYHLGDSCAGATDAGPPEACP